MCYHYLIKLIPRGRFFFGGDRAFTAQESAVYQSFSTFFPQQTAVLGALRFAILREKGLLESSQVLKEEKIGMGFPTTNFGVIEKLSPLFIRDSDGANWLPLGFDKQIYKQKNIALQVSDEAYPFIENYDPKENLELCLKNSKTNEWKKIEDFFVKNLQPGNQKARDGKAQPEGFYMQTGYNFKRNKATYQADYSFACYVKSKESLEFAHFPFLQIGADNSIFKVELNLLKKDTTTLYEDINTQNNTLLKTPIGKYKITLLSDAYVKDLLSLFKKCHFVLGRKISFRYIETLKSGSYYGKNRSDNQYKLLEKGTVLYTDGTSLKAVQDVLSNPTNYLSIGYNHFQIETKS